MTYFKNVLFRLQTVIGTGFFTGYSPIAPGTAGSLLTLLILWLLPDFNPLTELIVCIILYAAGIWSASALEKEWGKDPGRVTIDEVAGMAFALFALPKTIWIWLSAFILFRIFDIFKPGPVKTAEFLPGAYGIMADDIAAGIMANIACWVLLWIT